MASWSDLCRGYEYISQQLSIVFSFMLQKIRANELAVIGEKVQKKEKAEFMQSLFSEGIGAIYKT